MKGHLLGLARYTRLKGHLVGYEVPLVLALPLEGVSLLAIRTPPSHVANDLLLAIRGH